MKSSKVVPISSYSWTCLLADIVEYGRKTPSICNKLAEELEENDLVEGRIGSACGLRISIPWTAQCPVPYALDHVLMGQEAVQLHEQLEKDIVTLGRLMVRAATRSIMSVEVDT